MIKFSIIRMLSIFKKEFIKITRDTGTLLLIILFPVMEVVLFGYAMNVFPKHLPTAVISYDENPLTRRLVQGLSTLSYFDINYFPKSEEEAEKLLRYGKVNFIINIPSRFTHDMIRGDQPHVLLEVDGTVPGGIGNAIQSMLDLTPLVFTRELQGPLNFLSSDSLPFVVDVHTNYNASLSPTNAIIPGLIGLILTLSLIPLTSITIAEEKEFGTLEALLNSPIQPVEILVGKFLSYLFVGYIILFSTIFISRLLFKVPVEGGMFAIAIASLPFVITSLMIGLMASCLANTHQQALQYASIIYLPSILLSGVLFPFYSLPYWARIIGETIPLTHYNRIMGGLMIKGYTLVDTFPDIWPIILFFIFTLIIGIITFRKTIV